MDYMINNVTVVTLDENDTVLEDAFVGIRDGKVVFLSQCQPKMAVKEQIDGKGKVLMPGLINAHTHLPMSLMRGYADDCPLKAWLFDHIFPVEAKLDSRCAKAGMLLGIAECLRFGITSVSDMYLFLPEASEAARETGIKANLSIGAVCQESDGYEFENDKAYHQMRAAIEKNAETSGLVRTDVGIHAEYTSCEKLWRGCSEFASRYGLNIHLHLSETESEHLECIERYGMTPAALMEKYGVFNHRTSAAHCVYISEEDMDILREKQVTAIHNPVSNLKLGSGFAPVKRMLEKGVRVALGTDGACSNNSLDLFEEIKLSALLQKGLSRDPAAVSATSALKMATGAGAYAQGRENECGMIKEGMDADLIMLDFSQPWMQPVHDVHSSLCYCAHGSDVVMTMVRGRVLYRDGVFITIDIEKLLAEIKSYVIPKLF
ncbi:MAG: amidohydrolase [Clostridiaceae bacterium]|nr:amidohydrolase [Clostridiaceae bacterium]